MLSGLQDNMENMNFSLCGKQSKYPQNYNLTTLQKYGLKGTVR